MSKITIFVLALVSLVGSQSSEVKLAECAIWCEKNYPNPALTCVLPALRAQGPCYICGLFKTSPTEELCSGKCTETASDNQNCGRCGNVCPPGTTCESSNCQGICNPENITPFPACAPPPGCNCPNIQAVDGRCACPSCGPGGRDDCGCCAD